MATAMAVFGIRGKGKTRQGGGSKAAAR
jgi:hypothetical protein